MKHIEELAPNMAEDLLSKIALSVMPQAESNRFAFTGEESSYSELILEGIKKNLKLSETDLSSGDTSKITRVLSQELDKLVLANSNIKDIKERVGQKGLLRTADYKIEFSPSFRTTYQKIGIRPNHAEIAIRDNFSFQHIFPEEFGIQNTDAISLFLHFPTSDFCLLVMAVRNRATLIVCHAWRIYRSDINIFSYENPLSLMEAFIEKYGLEFKIAGSDKKTKFILYKKFSKDLTQEIHDLIEVYTPIISKLIINMYYQADKEKQSTEIGLAFILDLEKYRNTLKQYKIK